MRDESLDMRRELRPVGLEPEVYEDAVDGAIAFRYVGSADRACQPARFGDRSYQGVARG